jgi:hypothetical protein
MVMLEDTFVPLVTPHLISKANRITKNVQGSTQISTCGCGQTS